MSESTRASLGFRVYLHVRITALRNEEVMLQEQSKINQNFLKLYRGVQRSLSSIRAKLTCSLISSPALAATCS